MTTLFTTIRLALLIQYPDRTNQARVRLGEFDDYPLLFAWYLLDEVVRQVFEVGKSLRVWRTRHAEAVKMVFFRWVVIPYGPG